MSGPEDSRPSRDPQDRLAQRVQQARSVGYYTMIPTVMVVGPVLGFLLGNWLEGRFGHAPWFTLGFVILGGVASVRQLVLILDRANAASSRDRKSGS